MECIIYKYDLVLEHSNSNVFTWKKHSAESSAKFLLVNHHWNILEYIREELEF